MSKNYLETNYNRHLLVQSHFASKYYSTISIVNSANLFDNVEEEEVMDVLDGLLQSTGVDVLGILALQDWGSFTQ